ECRVASDLDCGHRGTVWRQGQGNSAPPAIQVKNDFIPLERCCLAYQGIQSFHLQRVHLKKRLRFDTEQPWANALMDDLRSGNVGGRAIEYLWSLTCLDVHIEAGHQVVQAVPQLVLHSGR